MHRRPAIIRELDKAKDAVVLVADIDPTEIPEDVHLVRGDPTSPGPLRRARPEGAIHALVTGAADGDVLVSAVFLHEQAPGLPISALVSSPAVSEALRELGINQPSRSTIWLPTPWRRPSRRRTPAISCSG